jgi:hypothetical protein
MPPACEKSMQYTSAHGFSFLFIQKKKTLISLTLGCPFFASQKDGNKAKQSKKDAKHNSKMARLSELSKTR